MDSHPRSRAGARDGRRNDGHVVGTDVALPSPGVPRDVRVQPHRLMGTSFSHHSSRKRVNPGAMPRGYPRQRPDATAAHAPGLPAPTPRRHCCPCPGVNPHQCPLGTATHAPGVTRDNTPTALLPMPRGYHAAGGTRAPHPSMPHNCFCKPCGVAAGLTPPVGISGQGDARTIPPASGLTPGPCPGVTRDNAPTPLLPMPRLARLYLSPAYVQSSRTSSRTSGPPKPRRIR